MENGSLRVRVRYPECDPMGVAHHGAYLAWFEMGRTELLRTRGTVYRDLESAGFFFAVASLSVRYHVPARYDDELDLVTTVARTGRASIDHEYELRREGLVLTTATTRVVCVDGSGRPRHLPETLQPEAV